MINVLKNIAGHWITLLKYGSVLRGGGVLIKGTQIERKQVAVFNGVVITGSVIGAGTRIHSFSVITNSTLKGNRIGNSSNIGRSTIGEYSYVADYAMINHTVVGRFCSIGPGFKCGLGAHPHNFISSSPFFYSELNTGHTTLFEEYAETHIGNDVWIGANVFVKDGVSIGDGAIVAAGSVVLKDVEAYAIVGGVPAKLIRYRHDIEVVSKLLTMQWWNRDREWLEANRSFFQKEIISVDDLNGLKF